MRLRPRSSCSSRVLDAGARRDHPQVCVAARAAPRPLARYATPPPRPSAAGKPLCAGWSRRAPRVSGTENKFSAQKTAARARSWTSFRSRVRARCSRQTPPLGPPPKARRARRKLGRSRGAQTHRFSCARLRSSSCLAARPPWREMEKHAASQCAHELTTEPASGGCEAQAPLPRSRVLENTRCSTRPSSSMRRRSVEHARPQRAARRSARASTNRFLRRGRPAAGRGRVRRALRDRAGGATRDRAGGADLQWFRRGSASSKRGRG